MASRRWPGDGSQQLVQRLYLWHLNDPTPGQHVIRPHHGLVWEKKICSIPFPFWWTVMFWKHWNIAFRVMWVEVSEVHKRVPKGFDQEIQTPYKWLLVIICLLDESSSQLFAVFLQSWMGSSQVHSYWLLYHSVLEYVFLHSFWKTGDLCLLQQYNSSTSMRYESNMKNNDQQNYLPAVFFDNANTISWKPLKDIYFRGLKALQNNNVIDVIN